MLSEEKTSVDTEEIAARAAVMEVPLYPDLSVRLKKALDYGPHVDVIQHLVYWFHPRHPKMQDRWSLYKTFAEWHDECGLTDRQVKKGRKKLQEFGILTWKRGQYGRVYYRVNWLRLAEVLNLTVDDDGDDDVLDDDFDFPGDFNPDTVGVPIDDDGDDLEDFNPDTVGVPIQSGHQGVQANPDTKASRFNPDALPSDPIQETTSGEYTRDYLTRDSSLQDGAEASRSAPQQINKEEEEEFFLSPQPGGNQRHSLEVDAPQEEPLENGEVSTPPLVEETKPKPLTSSEVNAMVNAFFNDDAMRNAAAIHLQSGEETTHELAKLLCRHLNKPEDEAERYETRLPDALEVLREELGIAA